MTPTIVYDAYRYATRDYADLDAHNRKMGKRHGVENWIAAALTAISFNRAYGLTECAARVMDRIEADLKEKGIVQ